MNRLKTSALATALALAAAHLPTTAHAWVKWTLHGDSGYCISGCTGGDDPYSYEKVFNPSNGDGPAVSITAWANTLNNDTTLHPSLVAEWGSNGLGVRYDDPGTGLESSGSPQHTMDNDDRLELMLFDFGDEQITLSEVTLGWIYSDADISVLAYTGPGTPDLEGVEYSTSDEDLTDSGWTLIGNYDVDSTDPYAPHEQDIDTDVSSSYWLIGAYNPALPGCETGSGYQDNCNWGHSNKDYVKLLALEGDVHDTPPPPPPPSTVPEPTTLLLLASAVPLLRRRRAAGG